MRLTHFLKSQCPSILTIKSLYRGLYSHYIVDFWEEMPRRRPARSTHPPLSTAHKVARGNHYRHKNYYLRRNYLRSTYPHKVVQGNYYLHKTPFIALVPLIPLCPLHTKLYKENIIYIEIILYIGATHPPQSTQLLKNQRPEIFAIWRLFRSNPPLNTLPRQLNFFL